MVDVLTSLEDKLIDPLYVAMIPQISEILRDQVARELPVYSSQRFINTIYIRHVECVLGLN